MLLKSKIRVLGENGCALGRVPQGVAKALVGTGAATVETRHASSLLRLSPAKKKPANKPCRPVAAPRTPRINALKNIVDMAGKFVNKKYTGDLLLTIDGDKLRVQSTDLTYHFSGYIEADDKYRFSFDTWDINSVCVNPDELKKLLPLTSGVVDVCITQKENILGIRFGEFFLEGGDAGAFPAIYPIKNERNRTVMVEGIADKLGYISKAIGKSPTRSVFEGILFDLKEGCMVCANGDRLHAAILATEYPAPSLTDKINACDGSYALVPRKILLAGKYLSGEVTGVVSVGTEKVQEYCERAVFGLNIPGCKDASITSQCIEGTYPRYKEVIPTIYKNSFTTTRDDIVSCLKKAQANLRNDVDYGCIAMSFSNEEGATAETKSYKTPIAGSYTGEPFKGLVNIGYVLDGIQEMPSGEIKIELPKKGEYEGWCIKGEQGFIAVIMPSESGE